MTETILSKLIESELKRRDLSYRQFGELVGISHVTVSRIIEGGIPDSDTCIKLSPILHLTPGKILDYALKQYNPTELEPEDQAFIDAYKNFSLEKRKILRAVAENIPDKKVRVNNEWIELGEIPAQSVVSKNRTIVR